MSRDFNSAFDDFLSERMGEDIANLKKRNERYGSALSERSELIQKAQNNGVDDYRQAFTRLAELNEYICDVESKFLFYAGMAARKKIDDAVTSYVLPERKTE